MDEALERLAEYIDEDPQNRALALIVVRRNGDGHATVTSAIKGDHFLLDMATLAEECRQSDYGNYFNEHNPHNNER